VRGDRAVAPADTTRAYSMGATITVL